jgi:hypothetical protein
MDNVVIKFVSLLFIAVAFSFILSYPLMELWNSCLVPAVTGLNEVSWTQMWGISILASLLIKSTN